MKDFIFSNIRSIIVVDVDSGGVDSRGGFYSKERREENIRKERKRDGLLDERIGSRVT